VRYALGHDRIAVILGEVVIDRGIGTPRHHLGQLPALELAQIIRRESFSLKVGRPEQALGAKQIKGLLPFGGVGDHIG
jgi:hypothetical protein